MFSITFLMHCMKIYLHNLMYTFRWSSLLNCVGSLNITFEYIDICVCARHICFKMGFVCAFMGFKTKDIQQQQQRMQTHK